MCGKCLEEFFEYPQVWSYCETKTCGECDECEWNSQEVILNCKRWQEYVNYLITEGLIEK